MKKRLLNYLVIVEPDVRTGKGDSCYTSYCPSLGLSDSGDTIEESIRNIEVLIAFHLKMLHKEQATISSDPVEKSLVTSVQIPYPSS
jgi:predicted RNase H-like HicB family nuclease